MKVFSGTSNPDFSRLVAKHLDLKLSGVKIMKVIIVGLGVQGYERRKFAGSDYVASVDPVNVEADYKSIENVPLNDFQFASARMTLRLCRIC